MLATKSVLIWDQVFGAEADGRVDKVMGSQTDNGRIAARLLTPPLWQHYDPAGYVQLASVFASLTIATYFGGATMSNATLPNELLIVLRTPSIDATAWQKAKMMDPNYSYSIPSIEAFWANGKAVADKYSLDIVAYGGGQHLLQPSRSAGSAMPIWRR